MKVGFFNVEPWEKKIIKQSLPKESLIFSSIGLSLKSISKFKKAQAIAVFVHSKITKEILDKLPDLKLIATMSTGYDHIDLQECQRRGITVCNVPTYGQNTVAEHTFALLLALSRKIPQSVVRAKKSNFSREGLRGFDLQAKTLGVVGGGNIGQHAIKMAKGFNMNVLVFDINKDRKLAKELGFKYTTLESLFKQSDIVTLHVPHNKHTHHLVNGKLFRSMKKGSYLINTSRGAIVDTHALTKALQSGKLAGAALDVMEHEDMLKGKTKQQKHILKHNKELLKMDNVLITAHNAFNTKEALERILMTTIKNIKGFKRGKVVNRIN